MTWKNTQALDTIFKENGYSYIDWNAYQRMLKDQRKLQNN